MQPELLAGSLKSPHASRVRFDRPQCWSKLAALRVLSFLAALGPLNSWEGESKTAAGGGGAGVLLVDTEGAPTNSRVLFNSVSSFVEEVAMEDAATEAAEAKAATEAAVVAATVKGDGGGKGVN